MTNVGIVMTDAELCDLARAGDAAALGELWQRHAGEALGYARKVNPRLAEDAVADALTTIFEDLRRGSGPRENFRSYLLVSVRNRIFRAATRDHTDPLPEDDAFASEESRDLIEQQEQVEVVHAAIQRLPERWQRAVWMRDVERKSLTEIGLVLGIETNAVSALLRRARAGLRRAWVTAHFSGARLAAECSNAIEVFGDLRWGKPSQRQREWFDGHIQACESCFERQGTHAWLAQAVGLALLPLVALTGALLRPKVTTDHPVARLDRTMSRTLHFAQQATLASAGAAAALIGGAFLLSQAIPSYPLQRLTWTEPVFTTHQLCQSGPVTIASVFCTDQDGDDDAKDNANDRDAAEQSFRPANESDEKDSDSQQGSSLGAAFTAPATPHPASEATAAPATDTNQTVPSLPDPVPAPNNNPTSPSFPSSAPSSPSSTEPGSAADWLERIVGSSRSGVTLEFELSDGQTVSVIVGLDGTFSTDVTWDASKPTFAYKLVAVR